MFLIWILKGIGYNERLYLLGFKLLFVLITPEVSCHMVCSLRGKKKKFTLSSGREMCSKVLYFPKQTLRKVLTIITGNGKHNYMGSAVKVTNSFINKYSGSYITPVKKQNTILLKITKLSLKKREASFFLIKI